ncbi:MAG TPA: hypothetical protein VFN30_11735 [Chitinophagaceae bacterium]|nr:hypothetical protein [Chitinophagaceae bacterium]
MQILNPGDYAMQSLSKEENIEITGGHDGVAYQADHSLGQVIKFVGTLVGFAALFFMPKS